MANSLANEIAIYAPNGARKGSIVAGIDDPISVTIDARGKIYVGNFQSNTITTYAANGTRTSPTITTGIQSPQASAVDDAGKIYVANARNGTVTTYGADGTPSSPTIVGLDEPTGIAVETLH